METALGLRFEPTVLVDYASEDGPRVLALKGALCLGGIQTLRQAGVYDEYAARLAAEHRDNVNHALASTWVPVETAMAHFEVLESMKLTETQLARLNEPLGANIFQTFFVSLTKTLRNAGIEGIWAGLKQTDRVTRRLYQGGGCRVTQVGPKDALIDYTGLPFAEYRSFRVGHCAFIRGIVNLSARTSVVRDVPPRQPRSERYTVQLSWV